MSYSSITSVFCRAPSTLAFGLQASNCMVQQVRNKWADWRMLKDVKRRRVVKQYAVDRLRIQTIRKNNILPIEIREAADKEIAAMPKDSIVLRLTDRCAFTSRPRGVVYNWRVSRIVWRDIADHNQLSGVQRAMW